jgi:hypothetical protein
MQWLNTNSSDNLSYIACDHPGKSHFLFPKAWRATVTTSEVIFEGAEPAGLDTIVARLRLPVFRSSHQYLLDLTSRPAAARLVAAMVLIGVAGFPIRSEVGSVATDKRVARQLEPEAEDCFWV